MERLVQLVIQDDEADSDTLSTLGQCLCGALHGTWSRSVFPATITPESIGELDAVSRFKTFSFIYFTLITYMKWCQKLANYKLISQEKNHLMLNKGLDCENILIFFLKKSKPSFDISSLGKAL